jgi:hypothetical protein
LSSSQTSFPYSNQTGKTAEKNINKYFSKCKPTRSHGFIESWSNIYRTILTPLKKFQLNMDNWTRSIAPARR